MRTLPFLAALAPCLALAVAACGDDSGDKPVDAAHSIDAAPDGPHIDIDAAADAPPAPATLTLSGTTKEISTSGTQPRANVTLTAYNAADDSVIGMATSDASGNFSITVQTGGVGVNGYVKANMGTMYKDTYLYPPGILTADLENVPVFLLTPNTYNLVNQMLLMNNQQATNGWIGVLVEDATGATVEGATISSTPMGSVFYNMNGIPLPNTTSTAADGIGYDTNVTAGAVVVAAQKTGHTFHQHTIKARADVVTLTIVSE